MGRKVTRKSSLKLMITRAEFIKKHLLDSKRNEYGEDEILVRDTKRLIELMADFDYTSDGGQMLISSLPEKMFQKFTFKKEQLLYRLEEIIALCTAEFEVSADEINISVSDRAEEVENPNDEDLV